MFDLPTVIQRNPSEEKRANVGIMSGARGRILAGNEQLEIGNEK